MKTFEEIYYTIVTLFMLKNFAPCLQVCISLSFHLQDYPDIYNTVPLQSAQQFPGGFAKIGYLFPWKVAEGDNQILNMSISAK